MFCPKCGCEYREGVDTCADCGVALVAERPEEAVTWHELVALPPISDPAMLKLVESVLTEAGIPFWARNEGIQDFFGFGRIGTGFNLAVGPVEIHVRPEDVEEARALLDDFRTTWVHHPITEKRS